jgi:hypothetical protein
VGNVPVVTLGNATTGVIVVGSGAASGFRNENEWSGPNGWQRRMGHLRIGRSGVVELELLDGRFGDRHLMTVLYNKDNQPRPEVHPW